MKKTKIFGIMMFTFLAAFLLSWVIPAGTFYNGEFTSGSISPVGIFDLVRLPISSMSYMLQYGLLLLAIGGFYGILNKTGVYSDFVESIVKKFKGKEKTFLIIVSIVLAVLSALTGLAFPLFVIIPFLVAVILSMGISKLTAMFATIGSLLVGLVGTLSRYGVSADINEQLFGFEQFTMFPVRLVFFVLLVAILVLFVVKFAKKDLEKEPAKKDTKKVAKEETKEEIILLEKNSVKGKSKVPMIIISVITMLLIIVGMYNWEYNLGITWFSEIFTKLSEVTVGDFPIITSIFSMSKAIGTWGYMEAMMVLVFASFIIGWLYSVKIKDMVTTFAEGAKKLLPAAVIVSFVSVLLYIAAGTSGESFVYTIINFLGKIGKPLETLGTGLIAMVSSLFFSDPYYLAALPMAAVPSIYANLSTDLMGLIFQVIYGLVMIIAPTSAVLVAGLAYFDISFKEWFKKVWKFLLVILGIVILVLVIATLFL